MDQLRSNRSGDFEDRRKPLYRMAPSLYLLEGPARSGFYPGTQTQESNSARVRVRPQGLEGDPSQEALENHDVL